MVANNVLAARDSSRGRYVGQLLRECGLPFEVRCPRSTNRDSPTLHTVYYVATTSDRFARLPDPVTVSSEGRAESWLNHPRALGQFLGYPTDAIDASKADACRRHGEWTDPIPTADIDRHVRPLVDQLYDEPPLPNAATLDAVLPYMPPLPSFSAPDDHLRRAVRYLEAGVRAEQYGIRVLPALLADHQRCR
ncbi:hypothetical protein ACFQMF_14950 [Halorubrum rutilum]|uniref:Uncharacterized protein n=1 Tax=Halorubrum rutilum TaxID=1364933 RepID=A0ABD6AP10_9EURY